LKDGKAGFSEGSQESQCQILKEILIPRCYMEPETPIQPPAMHAIQGPDVLSVLDRWVILGEFDHAVLIRNSNTGRAEGRILMAPHWRRGGEE